MGNIPAFNTRKEYLEYLIRKQIIYLVKYYEVKPSNLLDSNIALKAQQSFTNARQDEIPATFKELLPVAKQLLAEAILLEVLED